MINVALLLNPSFQWIREYNCSKDSDDTGPVFPILTNHAHSTGLLIHLSSSWFSFTFIFFCLSIFVSMYVFVLVSLCRLSTSVHLSFCVVVLSVLDHLHLGSFNLKIPHPSLSFYAFLGRYRQKVDGWDWDWMVGSLSLVIGLLIT